MSANPRITILMRLVSLPLPSCCQFLAAGALLWVLAAPARAEKVSPSSPAKAQPSAQAIDLRADYQKNPLALDSKSPRLSWVLTADGRGFKQSAYQILAATSRQNLDRDQAELWDSGKVSGDSSSVEYGGPPLASGAECCWKVRVWDARGAVSPWSEPACWGAGLLDPAAWKAEWIERKAGFNAEEASSPWFRKSFELTSKPARAIAYVGSAGYHELYVNGRKVDTAVLTPAVADLSKRTLYSAYDIAPLLVPGRNCVGVWAGRGWFSKAPGPRIRVLCRIQAAAGMLDIGSDAAWKCAPSPYTTLGSWGFSKFGGERYDARLENPNWNSASLDDAPWANAQVAPAPAPVAAAQACPLNRLGKRLPTVACENLADGKFKLDFGANVTGWLHLKLPKLAPGQTVNLTYADSLGVPNGVYRQTDQFISSGAPGEFCSKFNYHGFRTVTIEGLQSPPALADAEALLVESDLEPGGTFECSNTLFNRIHELHTWTIRCLDLGGYMVDCPHRERGGYGAEGQVPIESAICNLWTPAFYTKWLEDWRLAQNPATGAIPNTAPYTWGGGGPAWGGILSNLTWRMYLYYGDTRLVRENYAAMQHYLDFLEARCKGGLIQPESYGKVKWDFLADWVAPGRGMENDGAKWPPLPAIALFSDCYRITLWQIQQKAADVLGKTEDAARCRDQIAKIRRAVHQAYYDADKQFYVLDEQSYLLMPLLAGVVPEANRQAMTHRLLERITTQCNNHVETGVLGTWFLIRYLMESDRNDLLFDIASQQTYPSWGFMLAKGATTGWEQWNGHENWSHIHASFLSLDSWFYQGIAGIRPDESAPGFRKILIKPAIVGDLTWAKATYRSLHGTIVSHWQRDKSRLTLDVTIPANTTAVVYVPGDQGTIRECGRPASQAPGVKFLRVEGGRALYEVGSGAYTFESTIPQS